MMQLVVVAGRPSRRHRLDALAVARPNQPSYVERTHPSARLVPKPRQERRKPPQKVVIPSRHPSRSAKNRAQSFTQPQLTYPQSAKVVLGNTGLIVSEVALGTMQFGGKMNMGNLGQEDTTQMVKLAMDRGINFIDTADVYSLGESERLVGNALRGVRQEIVLATKVRLPMSENLNRSGATGENIRRAEEGGVQRLQTG